jgi:ArsR family transcriptional regulator, arsenate/arsenite/antimonite-responsive transcriptional repressor
MEVVVKDIAQFFKVLADEARLQMLWLLFNNDELCVCDLIEALGITQSKASRHLATLRHAGLVLDRKEAAWSYYSICPVENDFERSQLEALRTALADHAGADEILNRLRDWMKRKNQGSACTTDAPRNAVKKGKPAGRIRAPRKGGKR